MSERHENVQIYVDDKVYHPRSALPGTVMELVSQIRPELEPERLVVSIRCNGELVAQEALDDLLITDPKTYDRLEFESASAPQLATDALGAARDILSRSREHQQLIIQQLAENKTTEAIQSLAECIGGWYQAHDSVSQSLQLLGLNIDEVKYNETPIIEILKGVAQQLTQLKECLIAGDLVMLNDLLEYEITPSFDQWEGMVTAIIEEVHSNRPR